MREGRPAHILDRARDPVPVCGGNGVCVGKHPERSRLLFRPAQDVRIVKGLHCLDVLLTVRRSRRSRSGSKSASRRSSNENGQRCGTSGKVRSNASRVSDACSQASCQISPMSIRDRIAGLIFLRACLRNVFISFFHCSVDKELGSPTSFSVCVRAFSSKLSTARRCSEPKLSISSITFSQSMRSPSSPGLAASRRSAAT